VTPVVTLASFSPRLSVSSDGIVSVVQRAGVSRGQISVEQFVAGTTTRVAPLEVSISDEEVLSYFFFFPSISCLLW
jgi:hypothetical protein